MAWITPKTDWSTESYYNFSDVNRVESNTVHIADFVETYDTRPPLQTTKTNWNNADVPYYDDLNRIETNINIIKNHSGQPLTWTEPKTNWKTLDTFSYPDANRMEQNLLNLYQMVLNKEKSLLFCGSFACGSQNTSL